MIAVDTFLIIKKSHIFNILAQEKSFEHVEPSIPLTIDQNKETFS